MQGCVSSNVRSVHRAFIVQQELHHGHRANSCGSMKGKLLAIVFYSGRSFVSYELSGCLEVVLRRCEVQSGLNKRRRQLWSLMVLQQEETDLAAVV